MPAPKDPIKRAQWIVNISAARKGMKFSAEHIANNKTAHKGKKYPNISAALKGKKRGPHSAETISKISASQKEAQNRPEVKAKKSVSMSGRKLSPEHKEKISDSHKGKKYSAEHRAQISVTNEKRYENPEARAKTSASAKKQWENNPEERARRSAAWIGENNPNYVDGSCFNGSYPPYHENFNTEFKESIRDRDQYICQLCNKTEEQNGESLSVHHIFYDDETNDCSNSDNFVSLCRSCHVKTNINRNYWRYYFLDQLCFPMS